MSGKHDYVLAYGGVPSCWRVKPEDMPPPAPISVLELQEQVHAFAEETFGPDREDAAWKKLFEEIGETLKNPRDPGEWADVFIVLLDLAKLYGVDVGTASVAKMQVNRDRVWTKTETGVMQHVPGAMKPVAPLFSHWAIYDGGPCMTGSPILVEGNAPNQFRPANCEGRGGYYLASVDPSFDKRVFHYYKWDPNMGVPF